MRSDYTIMDIFVYVCVNKVLEMYLSCFITHNGMYKPYISMDSRGKLCLQIKQKRGKEKQKNWSN